MRFFPLGGEEVALADLGFLLVAGESWSAMCYRWELMWPPAREGGSGAGMWEDLRLGGFSGIDVGERRNIVRSFRGGRGMVKMSKGIIFHSGGRIVSISKKRSLQFEGAM